MSKPHKSRPIAAALLFLADDWLMDEGWHFNEAISTGISIRWCAAYIFHPRLIARLCHSWNFIYTMFPEGPFSAHLSFFSLWLPPFYLFFFPCHKIMLFLVSSGGAWNNLQRMIKPKAWRGYLQKCDTDRVPLLGFLLLPVRSQVQAERRQSWDIHL